MSDLIRDSSSDTAFGIELDNIPEGVQQIYQQNLAKRDYRLAIFITSTLAASAVAFVGGYVIGKERGKVAENSRCVQVLQTQANEIRAASENMAEDPERREELRGLASDIETARKSIIIYGGETE